MVIVRTVRKLHQALGPRTPGKQLGFVPTMGSLHEGHLSLLAASTKENDITVSSIFINPRQFNNVDDYKNYPRDEAADCRLLETHGCDLAFIPGVKDIYDGYEPPPVDLGNLVNVMEGKYRPGHFDGVALVVRRLFEIVRPTNAYFGEKDFQQLAVIRRLVRQAGLPVRVSGCPTIREQSGLALSSRNVHLTSDERKSAHVIFDAMKYCRAGLQSGMSTGELIGEAIRRIEKNGLFSVEYMEMGDQDTLQPVVGAAPGGSVRVFVSVRTSRTRLIDNLAL